MLFPISCTREDRFLDLFLTLVSCVFRVQCPVSSFLSSPSFIHVSLCLRGPLSMNNVTLVFHVSCKFIIYCPILLDEKSASMCLVWSGNSHFTRLILTKVFETYCLTFFMFRTWNKVNSFLLFLERSWLPS